MMNGESGEEREAQPVPRMPERGRAETAYRYPHQRGERRSRHRPDEEATSSRAMRKSQPWPLPRARQRRAGLGERQTLTRETARNPAMMARIAVIRRRPGDADPLADPERA